MQTTTENKGQRLVRLLKETAGMHTISQAAVGAVIPLAEELVKAGEDREATVQEVMEAGRRAQDDAATLRAQLQGAHEREEQANATIHQLRQDVIEGAKTANAEIARLREKLVEMAPPKEGPLRPTAETPVVLSDREWAVVQGMRDGSSSAAAPLSPAEDTAARAASAGAGATPEIDPVQRGHGPGTIPEGAFADLGGPPAGDKKRKGGKGA